MATVLQWAVILHMCRSGLAPPYLQNNPPTADGALSKTRPIQSVKDKDIAFNAITKNTVSWNLHICKHILPVYEHNTYMTRAKAILLQRAEGRKLTEMSSVVVM